MLPNQALKFRSFNPYGDIEVPSTTFMGTGAISIFLPRQINSILYYSVFVCLFVCLLSFFMATAEPFVLKFGMVFRNGVGQTAKQFGTEWMCYCRVIA